MPPVTVNPISAHVSICQLVIALNEDFFLISERSEKLLVVMLTILNTIVAMLHAVQWVRKKKKKKKDSLLQNFS